MPKKCFTPPIALNRGFLKGAPWYLFHTSVTILNVPFGILRDNLNGVSKAHVSLLLRGETSTVLLGDPSCFLVTTMRCHQLTSSPNDINCENEILFDLFLPMNWHILLMFAFVASNGSLFYRSGTLLLAGKSQVTSSCECSLLGSFSFELTQTSEC